MQTRNGLSYYESAKMGGAVHRERRKLRIEEYNRNPTLCKRCNNPLNYDRRKYKFCSKSCTAIFYNVLNRDKKLKPGNRWSQKPCIYCGNITVNKKFCSYKCMLDNTKQTRRNKIKECNALIDSTDDKWYLIETRGYKCEKCNNTEWMGQNIPIDVHHVDGNSDNNSLVNVMLLCPNCHRQTSTHGSKNNGKGKFSKRKQYRNDRYHKGLSY
jgi:predicted nucleic acid-binding Zn ribbon protein